MADPAREKLIEAVAESDDALIEEYLESGSLPEEHIVSGAKDGFARARLAPVICGSAAKAIGIDRLLDFIVEEFPSPADREPITVVAKDGGRGDARRGRVRPLAAYVFKTVSDPFVGHITMFRVFSGKVGPDSSVFDASQGTRRADQPAVHAARQGARDGLGGGPRRHRRGREAAARPHRRHLVDQGQAGDAPGGRAARAAARLRDRARVQGRRGQTLDRSHAAARGGPVVSGRAQRGDPRDGDLRHGRGAPRRADGAAQVEVRRRGRAPSGEDRLPRDDPGPRQGPRPPREAVGRPRAVRGLRHRDLPDGHAARASCSSPRSSAGRFPSSSSPRSRRASSRRWPRASSAATRWSTSTSRWSTGSSTPVDSSDMAFQVAGSLALKEAVETAGVEPAGAGRRAAGRRAGDASPATSWATSTSSEARSRAWSRSAAASSGSTRWCRRARSRAT